MSNLIDLEKQLFTLLLKTSFNEKSISLGRIFNQIPELNEEKLCDLIVLLYAHRQILGYLDGKNFVFETYKPDDLPTILEILKKSPTPIQVQILANPPNNPFKHSAPTSESQKTVLVSTPPSTKLLSSAPTTPINHDGSVEGDPCHVTVQPGFFGAFLVEKLSIENGYLAPLRDVSIKFEIPELISYFKVDPVQLDVCSEPKNLEIKIGEIPPRSKLAIDVYFQFQTLNLVRFEGILRYMNPNYAVRLVKLPSMIVNLRLPPMNSIRIPSFKIQEYLMLPNYVTGLRLFAKPDHLDPLVAFNYLKDTIKEMGLIPSHEDLSSVNYSSYFFAELQDYTVRDHPPEERLLIIVAGVQNKTMGFHILAPDDRFIAPVILWLTQHFKHRIELGGNMRIGLLELSCNNCGAVIKEFIGLGIKHICPYCGKTLIWK